MKLCPSCQYSVEDDAAFCVNCGAAFAGQPQAQSAQTPPPYTVPPQQPYTPPQPVYAPAPDPYDHTAEFDAADIANNKLFCMLVYLGDLLGVIVALLAAKDSPYVMFHVRQSLRFTILEVLTALATVLLAFTIVVPLGGVVAMIILLVLKVICFIQVCGGKAQEPAIIRDFKFLK